MTVSEREVASARKVARLVKKCLEEGQVVEIERLGQFRPMKSGGYEFIPNSAPKVFLAYVEEDTADAERLYRTLKEAGFDPWMDRQNLLPGQNWPRAIERAIEVSDFFVACLSPLAVYKRGVFQHELRFAMDAARRLPLDDVFFLPVRFEECTVPRRIQQHWQYVDLFPNVAKGTRRLVNMMRREWQRRGKR